MKFKIGDKVEVIGPLRSANDIRVGDIGVITDSMIGTVLEYQSKPIYRVDDKVCGWVGEDAIISRASDKPKIWRDMTDAEKGALLLAHHEGNVIEATRLDIPDDWRKINCIGLSFFAYRIRPEPKIETVAIEPWEIATDVASGHRITFQTINGKPDTTSIKMEAL